MLDRCPLYACPVLTQGLHQTWGGQPVAEKKGRPPAKGAGTRLEGAKGKGKRKRPGGGLLSRGEPQYHRRGSA